ncbi:CRY1 [Scenedesmus sp. PABB004]|nr:CRY1 [Scenedesmus sp. PABB004]
MDAAAAAAPAPAAAPSGTAVVLFRKDLRLDDNPALLAALQAAERVVPAFIWAPEEEGQFQPGRCSRWWLSQSLAALSRALAERGSRLVLRRAAASADALLELVGETGAHSVFFNHLYDPISLVRDHDMKRRLTAAGVAVRSYNADLLHEPWDVVGDDGRPFTTFARFWAQLQAMPTPPLPFPPPAALPPVDAALPSESGASLGFFASPEAEAACGHLANKWRPGPEGAAERLGEFLAGPLRGFSRAKARVDASATSRLSPWIHAGDLSVRTIFHRVRAQQAAWAAAGEDAGGSCAAFLQQLGYREYSRYLSFYFPYLAERPLLSHLRCVTWSLDAAAFKAWRMGMTGWPIVDAAMKELWSTGWCHNRMRVVAGAFAVKYLLLPWQWGLKHLWEQLLDADLESDALGWQYLAGCMADAPPFGQLPDLAAEAAAFDPHGEYVRRWLPALARLPDAHIHAPWEAPPGVLEAADVELGITYPYPLVDRDEAAARLERVAALIEQQLQAGQEGSGEGRGGASGASGEPFRRATAPLQAGSRGAAVAAAAAGAAEMRDGGSVLAGRGPACEAAVGWGWPGAVEPGRACAERQLAAAAAAAADPAAAAAAAAAGPGWLPAGGGGQAQHDDWAAAALEDDHHLRERRRQRHAHHAPGRRRHKAARRAESEGSEVESSAPPAVSEGLMTACSGAAPAGSPGTDGEEGACLAAAQQQEQQQAGAAAAAPPPGLESQLAAQQLDSEPAPEQQLQPQATPASDDEDAQVVPA